MALDSVSQMAMHAGYAHMHSTMRSNLLSGMSAIAPGATMGVAGDLMSSASAIGGAASGLAGMLPLHAGLGAAKLAWGAGAGVLGAGAAALPVLAGGALAVKAVGMAGNQMMVGAQQQYALNRGLASNFHFMNSQGGTGFTTQQGYQIGSGLRELAGQFGPAGEVTSFSELSSLAQNMGRMGMAQNVRTVKEFKEKFTTMLTTLKTVATELGTTLEEAQKTISSMRSVGIFGQKQQIAGAQTLRRTAIGSGLAQSEVSGMMDIGAQISRSVGGLGKAGAFGGAKTIGNIGSALKLGVLSEEDVYNATGLTGAEGRQAMATDMMQRSAQFLKSGKGRWFLASVAGKDGKLDHRAVAEWMQGGVGTGRTRQLAKQNTAGAGRWNFVRNEGRLRGAALEQFGGLSQTMAYKDWLTGKGWAPDVMNDKTMLAFQKYTGMGRDEAESAVKMVQQLPELYQDQIRGTRDIDYSDRLRKQRKSVGIEGVKRQFEQAKSKVHNALEQAGANILRWGERVVGEAFTKFMGEYERSSSEDIKELVSDVTDGRGMSNALRLIMDGSSALNRTPAERNAFSLLSAATRDPSQPNTLGLTTDVNNPTDTQFSGNTSALESDGKSRASLARFDREGNNLAEMRENTKEHYSDSNLDKWRREADRNASKKRMEYMNAHTVSARDQRRGEFLYQAGVGKTGSVMSGALELVGAIGTAGISTFVANAGDTAFQEEIGQQLRTREMKEMIYGLYHREGKGGGESKEYSAAREKLEQMKLRDVAGGKFGADHVVAAAADIGGLSATLLNGKSYDDLTDKEKSQLTQKVRQQTGNHKLTYLDIKRADETVRETLDSLKGEDSKESLELFRDRAEITRDEYSHSGIGSYDKDTHEFRLMGAGEDDKQFRLNKDTIKELKKGGIDSSFLSLTEEMITAASKEMFTTDQIDNYGEVKKGWHSALNKMSIQQRKNFAQKFAGMEAGRDAAASVSRQNRLDAAVKQRTQRGFKSKDSIRLGAAADYLGSEISNDDLNKAAAGTSEEGAKALLKGFGFDDDVLRNHLKDPKIMEKLKEGINAAKKGNTGVASGIFSDLIAGNKDLKADIDKAKSDRVEKGMEASNPMYNMVSGKLGTLIEEVKKLPKEPKGKDNPETNSNKK